MSDTFPERENIRNLLPDKLRSFRAALEIIMNINDDRGFRHIAGYHGFPDNFCIHGTRTRTTGLSTRLFLPWHRAYLKELELRLQAVDPTVNLPYWNWASKRSSEEGIPRELIEPMIDGKPNPLYNFRVRIEMQEGNPVDFTTQRIPDESRVERPIRNEDLPTQEAVDDLLTASTYGEFSDQVEDMHNGIHGWVGGTMTSVATAAFDPIFWLHHCNIDRLWWKWQNEHTHLEIPDSFKKICLMPFGLNVEKTLNIYDLGYEYYEAATKTVGGIQ